MTNGSEINREGRSKVALIFLTITSCILAFAIISLVMMLFKKDYIATRSRIENLFAEKSESFAKHKDKKDRKQNKAQRSLSESVLKNLSAELSLAGVKLRADEFMTIWMMAAFIPAGLSLLWKADWIVSMALVILGVILPYFFVRRAKAKRLALFEQQLSDALIIIGNCLRTGLSFEQAISSIARDMPEPISKEFARVSKEVHLGLTMENALENMVERLKSKDFMLIVAAVLIQRQVGGNLSEILDGISDTIRERLKIKTSIKVLTASGRTSGMGVGLMPVFILFMLMLINPPYLRMFFETQIGIIMLCIAGGLEVVGFLFVKKIVSIKF